MTKATTVKKRTRKSVAKIASTDAESYKHHRLGSRKAKVHLAYDTEGVEAAKKLGEELGLAAGTITSWCGVWKRTDEAAKKKPAQAARKATTIKRSR